jgi:hypothetical protein
MGFSSEVSVEVCRWKGKIVTGLQLAPISSSISTLHPEGGVTTRHQPLLSAIPLIEYILPSQHLLIGIVFNCDCIPRVMTMKFSLRCWDLSH